MQINNHIKSRRTGFTLIEIVLVMAILILMISTFFAVFSIINTSHANVAVMNDAKDYVQLNMEAVNNLIVNSKEIEFCNDPTWYVGDANTMSLYFDSYNHLIDPTGTIYNGSLFFDKGDLLNPEPAVFTYPQYTIGSGLDKKNKWYIEATFSIDPAADSKIVKVVLVVMNNSKSPAVPYSGGRLVRFIYVPNLVYNPATDGTTGSVMKCLTTTLG